MRNSDRIPYVIGELGKLWRENAPDWRFCQLMSNFFCYKASDCFYVEDDDFLEYLKEYLNSLKTQED